jgi:hypothetical protein
VECDTLSNQVDHTPRTAIKLLITHTCAALQVSDARSSLVARRKRAKKLRQRLQTHAHTHAEGERGAVTMPAAAAVAAVARLSKAKGELERNWAAGKLAGVEGATADVHALLDAEVREWHVGVGVSCECDTIGLELEEICTTVLQASIA